MDIHANKLPLVSVRLMTYNQADFIKDTIDGIMIQRTNFFVEVVVGDDFSTDDTLKIIRSYSDKKNIKIRILNRSIGDEYWQIRQRLGRLNNFTNTIENCKGKYIALLDGDDYWSDPYKLQKQVDFLEENPEYGMVSADIDLIDENGNTIPDNNMVLKQRANYKSTVDFFDLLKINQINTLTVCARADLMKYLAERVVKENLWFVYDYWFWLNISSERKVRVLDEKMAAYRVHNGGISKQKDFFKIRKVLVQKDALNEALKKKHLNNKQFCLKYGYLLYHILRSRNTEALAYILKLKK
ncbi:MAG: glycosyltransferase [Bacteroidota bacterium]